MTTEEKVFIEHKINAVCGGKIGTVHPEFFITATGNVKIVDMDNTAGKYPHFKMLLVNAAGGTLDFGEMGCN